MFSNFDGKTPKNNQYEKRKQTDILELILLHMARKNDIFVSPTESTKMDEAKIVNFSKTKKDDAISHRDYSLYTSKIMP